MENWKSTMAFMVFIGVYIFSVVKGAGLGVIDVTGFIALYSSLFMMLRSDFTADMLSKLIDNIKLDKTP